MMKKYALLLCLILPVPMLSAITVRQEVRLGYMNDLGLSLNFRLDDIDRNSDWFLNAGAGFIWQADPGNAEDARRIFINDGTGGTVQEYGTSVFVGLDFGRSLYRQDGFRFDGYLSGKWNFYRAHFAFIGDNEAFTVKTDQPGLGLGFKVHLNEGNRAVVTVDAGADLFFNARIYSHGTYYYNPGNVDDRPRNAYTYADADASINNPKLRFYLTLGLLYPIG